MQLGQLPYKVLLRREDRGSSHQDHHDLAGGEAAAHQDVAEPSGGASLIVDGNLEVREHPPNIHDDGVCRCILYHAAVNRDNPMAAGLVHPGDHLFSCIQCEGRRHLVAVMCRIRHTDDLLHMAEVAKEPYFPELLVVQLLGIGHSLKLAAAAPSGHRTGLRVFLFAQGHHPPLFLIILPQE